MRSVAVGSNQLQEHLEDYIVVQLFVRGQQGKKSWYVREAVIYVLAEFVR